MEVVAEEEAVVDSEAAPGIVLAGAAEVEAVVEVDSEVAVAGIVLEEVVEGVVVAVEEIALAAAAVVDEEVEDGSYLIIRIYLECIINFRYLEYFFK